MPITVIVRAERGAETQLTFDGMQRVVIGRGASCDVRLPDSSVSHRHASLRGQGSDFFIFDEGSTNGTFVEGTLVAPHTSRMVRSGDRVRVGRLWFELRIDQVPATRDIANATRDLALALVAQAMASRGEDSTPRVRVVEGPDRGATLLLREEGRAYVLGRGTQCDLALADPDVSREHAHVARNGRMVLVCDLAAKNGTWLGEVRADPVGGSPWRASQTVRIGRTVLALEEPMGAALAAIESAPDEAVAAVDASETAAPPGAARRAGPAEADPSAAAGVVPETSNAPALAGPAALVHAARARRKRGIWSMADLAVMTAALGLLALSIAGLVWLLR